MKTIRASGAGLAYECPESATAPVLRIEGDREPADVGNAVHSALGLCVRHGYDPGFAESQANIYGVDAAEVSILTRMGWACWKQVKDFFPSPVFEQAMREDTGNIEGMRPADLEITGHADVLSCANGLRVLDWKTGRLDEDHEHQLKAYCWLALQNLPQEQEARACLVRVREGTADWYTWSRADLNGWALELAARLNNPVYRPGLHCRFCPRAKECPGRNQALQAASKVFFTEHAFTTMPSDKLGDLVGMARDLHSFAEDLLSLAKAEVVIRGGVVELNDGRSLVITEQERREVVWSMESAPIVYSAITPEAAIECLTLGKTKLEKAVKASAPRGQKEAAWEEVMGRLEKVGAVTVKVIEKLEVKKNGSNSVGKIQQLGATGPDHGGREQAERALGSNARSQG